MSVIQEDIDHRDIDKIPTIMALFNILVLLPLAYNNMSQNVGFWDFIFVLAGVYFGWKFIRYIIAANTYKQGRFYPKHTNKIVNKGIYSKIRYPIGAACIYLNIAYVLLFRALVLIPVIPFFIFMWFIFGKMRDDQMTKEFGDEYKFYMLSTGMFREKSGAEERLASSGYGMY